MSKSIFVSVFIFVSHNGQEDNAMLMRASKKQCHCAANILNFYIVVRTGSPEQPARCVM